jgi:hypothetical protein
MTELEEIKSLGISNLEYYYLVKRDIIKFKIEMDNFIGGVCRRHFPGFEQRKERYKELREDTFIFVMECLEGKKGEKYRYHKQCYNRKGELVDSKFPSYLHLLIRWNLSNYFRRWNKERKTEISLDGIASLSSIPIKERNSLIIYVDEVEKIVKQFNLNIEKDDIENFVFYSTKNDNKEILNNLLKKYSFEFKLISWFLYKKCKKELVKHENNF